MFLWNNIENITFAPSLPCELCVKPTFVHLCAFASSWQKNRAFPPLRALRETHSWLFPQFPVVFPLANFPLYMNFTQ
jgi:hypothetical protein